MGFLAMTSTMISAGAFYCEFGVYLGGNLARLGALYAVEPAPH